MTSPIRVFAGLGAIVLAAACPSDDSEGQAAESTDTGGIVTVTPTAGDQSTDDSILDTSGSSSTADRPDDDCGESEFQVQVVPTRVVIVIDKSGSMVLNTWDHDADTQTEEITRWASLHATVEFVTATFDAAIEFGAVLYPALEATSTYDADACIVEDAPTVPVAPLNAQSVMEGIPDAMEVDGIRGGTPSRAAVAVALEHLRTFDAEMPRAILFITDGEANCQEDAPEVTDLFEVYDEALHELVAAAWDEEGIPTYVVGIAIRNEVLPNMVDGAPNGINPHEKLIELAVQGGRPQAGETSYYATENEAELEMALAEIVGQQFSCLVPLDPAPEYPDYVEVEIGGQTVPRVDDCATEDGWVFVGPDMVELCGTACDLLATEGQIQAFYGCPPAG